MSDSEGARKEEPENGQNGEEAQEQGNHQSEGAAGPAESPEHAVQSADGHKHRGQSDTFSYRRGGRGQYRRGRGGRGGYVNHRQQFDNYEEEAADGVGQWNSSDRGSRGRGQGKRYSRGRQRTRSEKSSLLDGKREPLPDINLDEVELYHDVVVSGYNAEMTEEDLWDVFGQHDVAGIVQLYTHDSKPYCHIYTTSDDMRDELLRCNRDMFRGNMLFVAMSEDIVSRGVSQMQKKKVVKPKFKKNINKPSGEEPAPEVKPEESSSPKEEHEEE